MELEQEKTINDSMGISSLKVTIGTSTEDFSSTEKLEKETLENNFYKLKDLYDNLHKSN